MLIVTVMHIRCNVVVIVRDVNLRDRNTLYYEFICAFAVVESMNVENLMQKLYR